jgi:glutathione S-transferase
MTQTKPKLVGAPPARVTRPLWAMAELGLDFDHDPIVTGPPHLPKSPELVALNPMGQTPVLVDGDVVMAESLAINLYLAQTYGQGTLWPDGPANVAKAYQWTLFGAFNLERPVLPIMIHRMSLPPEYRREDVVQKSMEALKRPLSALNTVLAASPWLAGNRFTIADLNVASIFNGVISADVWFEDYPAFSDWLKRCYARPSATGQKVHMQIPPQMAEEVAKRDMPL